MAARSVTTRIPAPLLLMAIVETVILYASVYIAAFVVFQGDFERGEQTVGRLLPRALSLALLMLFSLVAVGLYQFHQRIEYSEVSTRVLVGFALGSIALIVLYGLPESVLATTFWILAMTCAAVLILLVRLYFVRNVDENVFRRKTLIYGSGQRAEKIAALRRRADRRGFKIVGQVPTIDDDVAPDSSPARSTTQSLSAVALESGAEEIVIAVDDRRGNLPIRDLLDRRLRGVKVIDLVEFLERETGKIPIDLVTPGWLIFSEGFRQSRARKLTKRVRDLAIAGAALLVTWPVLIAIAVAIKLEDGWRSPVFYKQQRIGYLGEPFLSVEVP